MRATLYNTLMDKDSLLPYLIKEESKNFPEFSDRLQEPELIAQIANRWLRLNQQTEERVYLFCLSTNCKLIGVFEISHGTGNASLARPREIILKTLLCNATGIVLIHNHPSGDVTPSRDDCAVVERMKDACEIVGLNFLDFIIVGYDQRGDKYYSIKRSM